MGDLVNLKRFRKKTERKQAEKQAELNRARFGRSKTERMLERQRADRAAQHLDEHRLDHGVLP